MIDGSSSNTAKVPHLDTEFGGTPLQAISLAKFVLMETFKQPPLILSRFIQKAVCPTQPHVPQFYLRVGKFNKNTMVWCTMTVACHPCTAGGQGHGCAPGQEASHAPYSQAKHL